MRSVKIKRLITIHKQKKTTIIRSEKGQNENKNINRKSNLDFVPIVSLPCVSVWKI